MRILVVFILAYSFSVVHAQNLDSIKTLFSKASYKESALLAKSIGTFYLRQNNYDSADKYFDIAIKIASDLEDYKTLGKSLNNKGVSYYYRGKFAEAIYSYQEALEVYRVLGNDTLISQSLTNLGLNYKGLSIYDKSLECLYESAEILERLSLKRSLSANWDGIGNIHREMGNMDISLSYLERSLSLRKEIEYNHGIAQSLHNIGIWYLEDEDYDTALKYFLKALTLKKDYGNKKALVTTLSKIGEIYVELEKFELAMEYFQESLKLRLQFSDQLGTASSLNHLANLHFQLANLDSVFHYLNLAQNFGAKSESLNELARTYKMFQDYYSSKKDFASALEYADSMATIRAAILDKEKAKFLVESEVRYEVGRKEQEIARNQDQLEFLKARNFWLLLSVAILVLLIIVFVRLYYVSRKLSKEREKGKVRVEKLLKELHHRTKNHLQAQSALIRLQSRYLKDDSSKNIMLEVSNRMKAVTLIHQSLYNSSEHDPSENIDLSEYLKNLTENLMISFKYNRNKINIEYRLTDVTIDVYTAVPIGLFVNEAITNAFKYAFSQEHSPTLKVELIKEDLKLVTKVVDNGKGFEVPDWSGIKSFGLTAMYDISKQLHGEICISMNQGTTVELRIPIKKATN